MASSDRKARNLAMHYCMPNWHEDVNYGDWVAQHTMDGAPAVSGQRRVGMILDLKNRMVPWVREGDRCPNTMIESMAARDNCCGRVLAWFFFSGQRD